MGSGDILLGEALRGTTIPAGEGVDGVEGGKEKQYSWLVHATK